MRQVRTTKESVWEHVDQEISRASSPERKVTLLLPKQRDKVKDLRDKVYRYAYVYSYENNYKELQKRQERRFLL